MTNNTQPIIDNIQAKPRDLEERTFNFAKEVTLTCKTLPRNLINDQYTVQVVRSSGSVGANYIEANERLGKKDLVHKIRITRKECKETSYWLRLIKEINPTFAPALAPLIQESKELRNIFTAILAKISNAP